MQTSLQSPGGLPKLCFITRKAGVKHKRPRTACHACSGAPVMNQAQGPDERTLQHVGGRHSGEGDEC